MKLSEVEILEGINELFDGVFPLYLYCALFYVIVLVWRELRKDDENEVTPQKNYTFIKRSELAKWKRIFEGKWDNVRRDGFYEVNYGFLSNLPIC